MKDKDLKEVAIYILQLEGDPVNSSGTHIIEVAGVSLDKRSLERIRKDRSRELEGLVEEDDCGFVTYMNTDYSDPPEWVIREVSLIGSRPTA